eukprot:GHVR01072289.1.p3 GENE.GHVR01072289.1~~GHVR01072289.1.p3  ORF type:complete len:201 (+),score=45.72 GHVR01072289.1:1412-2014(+)
MADKPTIQRVIDHYNLEPNRARFIRCPAHDEKTPSCKLYDDWWYCHGCGANGDSLGLIAAILGVPIGDVLREYGEKTSSWKDRAKQTKHLDTKALSDAPHKAYRNLMAWFWRELHARLLKAPDWLLERTIMYWSEVFEDTWDQWFVRKAPDYVDGLSIMEREERLKALAAALERGLGLERLMMWDREDGEWHLAENRRTA